MLVTFVSFFNELATKKRNYARDLYFIFNELAIEKRIYARRLSLIMASKRIMLWKETMSRDKTQSWIPRDLHWMEENHSGRNTCRGSR
jgi:hypothetical protein